MKADTPNLYEVVYVNRILSAISALIWLALIVICIPALTEPRNFAVIWIIPYLIQLVCNLLVLFKKQIPLKVLGFYVCFGLLVAISPVFFFGFDMILSLPIYTYIPVIPAVLSVFQMLYGVRKQRD